MISKSTLEGKLDDPQALPPGTYIQPLHTAPWQKSTYGGTSGYLLDSADTDIHNTLNSAHEGHEEVIELLLVL